MSIKNFSFRSVGSYIQENIYWIPDYQREYSWETEVQIEDFWRDLESLIEENREQHFLGQVVVHASSEDNKKYIIDGQQRTSTAIIFLSAVNSLFEHILKEYDYKTARNRCEDIRLKYIGRFSEEENELKLILGKIDREYFIKNIQSDIPKINTKEEFVSHNRIKNAFFFFEEKLKEKLKTRDGKEQKYDILNLYYSTFIEKFKVMYVETDDINEAFIIFETLNARGKELETADLLKNHVFRISGCKINFVKQSWEELIDLLDNIDPTKFIRHFWNSRSSFTREKDLYKKIRDSIVSPIKSEEFIKDLIKGAELYRELVNPKDENYFSNINLVESLSRLKDMNASSFYPIILAMNSLNFSEDDMFEVAKKIEVLVFRNCVVAGRVANKYEVIFAKIALNIYDEDYTNKDEIIGRINKEIISDDEFEHAFSLFKSKKKVIIRYILTEINNSLNKEIKIIDDNDKIHIEHIMPKSKGKWNISDDEHQEYLWRIGNLTLLGSEYNKKNSNKIFEEKKGIYLKSKIDISNDLKEYKQWTIKEIEHRQRNLAKVALDIWSIK